MIWADIIFGPKSSVGMHSLRTSEVVLLPIFCFLFKNGILPMDFRWTTFLWIRIPIHQWMRFCSISEIKKLDVQLNSKKHADGKEARRHRPLLASLCMLHYVWWLKIIAKQEPNEGNGRWCGGMCIVNRDGVVVLPVIYRKWALDLCEEGVGGGGGYREVESCYFRQKQ